MSQTAKVQAKATRAGKTSSSLYIIGLALVAVYLFWGGTYLGMKVAIESMPPFLMAGARFFSAGLVLYIISRLTGARRPGFLEWRSAVIVGALLLLGGNGMVAWAEQRVSSSVASLIIAAVPVWMMLLGWSGKNGKRPGTGVITGIVLGFLGIAVLVLQPGQGSAGDKGFDVIGITALLAASISWAAGSIYSRSAKLPGSPLMSTAAQMLTGGVLLIIFSYFTGDWGELEVAGITARSYLAFGYLVLFGSIVAYTAYIWLLKNAEPSLVSTYAFVNPVVAVLLGWLLAGEQLTAGTWAAAVIIIAAVAIVTVFRSRVPGGKRKDPSNT
ncbi:EamA family transporter [Paenibacillus tianjinensis]|uniref:EamA family transporter n=1 Tax=Paenibacillus tianjinensis TaxID=2810347 RepID=A0ABX7LD62_9BACL|nr:EamA family transporter [Paenibacillus tianjinensis]QSF44410.1 EamA family transporter [Paenibacillus tianjinensis]